MRLIYQGRQCLLIEGRRLTIVVDPGRQAKRSRSVLPESEWKAVDIAIATYDDPSYVGYLEEVARKRRAQILCQAELADALRLAQKGQRAAVIEPGKRKVIGGIRISGVVPEPKAGAGRGVERLLRFAQSPRAALRKPDAGGSAVVPIGFTLEFDSIKLSHLGGADDPHLWDRIESDVLLVPVGGTGLQFNADSIVLTAEKIAPRHVVTFGDTQSVSRRILHRGELDRLTQGLAEARFKHTHLDPGGDFLYK